MWNIVRKIRFKFITNNLYTRSIFISSRILWINKFRKILILSKQNIKINLIKKYYLNNRAGKKSKINIKFM